MVICEMMFKRHVIDNILLRERASQTWIYSSGFVFKAERADFQP